MRWLMAVREKKGDWGTGFRAASCTIKAPACWQERIAALVAAAGHRPASDGRYALVAAEAPELPPESYRIRFVPAEGRGTLAIAASDARGAAYAARTAAELMGAEPGGEVTIEDGPAFAVRGVVEGFYGRPWSHAERLDALAFMGGHRLNTYMYAPKDDAYHRRLWRIPYGRAAMGRFRALAGAAARHGVDFGVAISPGLSLRYSDEGDYRFLLAKYRQFTALGLRVLGLYLDDIPGRLVHEADRDRFGTLARAQAALANRLRSDLAREIPRLCLVFCPTEYCGQGGSAYLRELGELLDPSIEVHWTGNRVCARRITRAEAQRVGEALRRPPLYWDNYPVNDYFMVTELHLGPYRDRAADLAGAARGVLANPMNQALASRPALASMARYLWRPECYDPREAALEAYADLVPEPARAAFAHFAAANAPGPFRAPAVPRQSLALARRQEAREDRDGARRTWAAEAHRLAGSAAALRAHLPEPLKREIGPWLDEYRGWAVLAAAGLFAEAGFHKVQGAKGKGEKLAAYLRLERDLARLRRGLSASARWRTGVCGREIHAHLVDQAQRLEGVLRVMSPFPAVLRPLLRFCGRFVTGRRAFPPPGP